MEKGNLGIRLGFYGVAAFILAYLGSTTLLFLLAGVVLIAEKNEWATRQVIQALCLCVVSNVVMSVIGIFDFVYRIPYLGSVWNVFTQIIDVLLEVAVLVFVIVGILKNLKGNDANIPLASNVADWVYGVVKEKPVKVVQPQVNGQLYCTGCGAPIKGGAFCSVCGKPVVQPAPQAAP